MRRCPPMNAEEKREQEFLIRPDGRLEIAWITPQATPLILEVHRFLSEEPFPVGLVSGNLYCG
jgi:hypothetical protein